MATFCFESNVSLSNVENSLKILLLPRDIVELRGEDNCIDVVTTPDRANLFEKFLSKRYSLKREVKPSVNEVGKQCLIEFKTTNKIKRQEDQFKLGTKNAIKSGESESSQVSSMDLLLGDGVPGELSAGSYHLAITCRLIGDKANLVFSFADKDRASVKTEVMLKKNEWLNIASVIQELKDKNKTLGIPQSEVASVQGTQETQYEIQLK